MDLSMNCWWTNEEVTDFTTCVLTVAAEGGIGYWATYNTVRNEDAWVLALDNVWDAEEETLLAEEVTITTIWETLQDIAAGKYDDKVASRILDDIRADLKDRECCQIDAEGADVIVQLAIFGELVYG